MQQEMHLHCCISLFLFFIWYPENCYMCCDGRNKNEVKIKNKNSDECRVSIQTMWINESEREKSADLLDCLQMETCSVYFTKSKNNTCLCTSKLCARIQCTFRQKDCTQLSVTCNMETVAANHDDCFSYPMTDELTDQLIHILEKETCTKHRKTEYQVKEINLSIREYGYLSGATMDFSDIQTDAVLHFKEQNNSMILQELQDAVSDLLIATNKQCSVIVISRKSTTYLCVTGSYKNICIIIKCKEEKCFKDNETISTGTQDMQCSLTNIWKHWKDKILLVIFGVLMFGGIVGFLIGMIFARKRKIKLHTEDKRRHPRHTCNSELYAEISESSNIIGQGRNENISEEVELGNIPKRSASDCMVSSRTSRHSMEGAYSNIYNVLQQNYGQRRNSYPIDDMDTKTMFNKYYSLEKLDVPKESEDQLHIRDKTPISTVLLD